MYNYKITIEYDGSAFNGWQVQPGLRTVQGEIEKAVIEVSGRKSNVICAGRTDSGVHAFGQVANFKSRIDWGEESVRKALNRVLPDDIVLLDCEEVDSGFNARFDAIARYYEYRIFNARSSIRRNFCWQYPAKINFACLKRLSAKLLGEHDFKSFCVRKSQKKSNLCTVTKSHWTKRGKEYNFQIIANRFLHGMVRSLVGTMIKISAGFQDEEVFEELLERPKRSEKVFTAPPNGLYLMKVEYDLEK
ncbi:MAG: tRNA pseudouridine(38-40) synthase TruA [candidate division Zixibacteria bacterium]|nr:tRNA pseudouridine(38-40) synthase TruA [candidate division Zixibacteria bacterium]